MGRYLGEDDTGENISKAEANELHGAGHKIVVVYQVGKRFMLEGGFNRGVQAAMVAIEQAIQAGMPGNRPIYFSLDADPAALSAEEWEIAGEFLDGARAVIGWGQVGLYGGRAALDRFIPSHAAWGWQTASWSQGLWSSWANIHQYAHNLPLCGGIVDLNRAVTADYGQW